MRHGSLFSGIGGFDLAAEWMGWENVFHCEWMPFQRQILNYYWPNAQSYEDITKTDFTIHRGTIDILTGGFPCQPYSAAGKRLGKDDERHLWPQMLRAIQEIEPTYVVGENVRGLTNWNGGLVFEEVCIDLENSGYEIQPILLPSCAVGAPHRRDRVWFVAKRIECKFGFEDCSNQKYGLCRHCENGENYECWFSPHPTNIRQEYAFQNKQLERRRFRFVHQRNIWDTFPSESPLCRGDDGISKELDKITFSKWREESLKSYGNAIVPQLGYEIFKVIEKLNGN